MTTPLVHRLYLRIWFAVVAAVFLLTLLFGWLRFIEAEHERAHRPAREIVFHDKAGRVIGQTIAQPRSTEQGFDFEVTTLEGQQLYISLPRPSRAPPPPLLLGGRGAIDFAWLLILIALAVAMGAYPVVRRLTKRLESLQMGVTRWGQGDLSQRLPEAGKDEVAFLAQRFNVAAERVQALLVAHKTLLANASHELRSPLTRIRMGLELQPELASSAKEEITRNIRELDQLIDEILLASRLDANPIDIDSFEPVDLVGLCAEECAQANAELDVPAGQSSVTVNGVPRLLRRVVRNLLDNARRHAASDIRLSLQLDAPNAVIRVFDRGPGVPLESRKRIFEPFYRLPGASERDGGVGLGLALVKSIAVRHGGTVSCDARPGGGACFTVELPLLA